ncbi:MAG TPA: sulfatase-like hydrolase/transferase [Nocardioidaceae bacterium]|nr:sulfatase-like hydrolase/transferase [Nocardioidaceae bacterium]
MTAVVALALPGLALPGPQVAAAPGTGQPNIVLITTDDQNVEDLRHMPYTLELLGGEGVTFDDAISSYPLCCPARATILTGQHAHNHGVLANEPPAGGWEKLRPKADRTLPVWLQNAGYRTTFTGKFLNTYGRTDKTEVPPGWNDWHAIAHRVYDFDDAWVNENGTLVDHTGDYQADITQDVTEEAIRQGAEDGQPFFVWQSNLAPHGACSTDGSSCTWGPPVPAPQDRGTFDGLPLYAERLPSFNERVAVEKPARISRLRRLDAVQVADLRDLNEKIVESLQAVDRNVRDTVELLDSLGQLDNTLIVFASDNGYLLGQHRWKGKVLGYEPSLRVPLMMRGPGVPAGAVVDETVSLVDIAATLAEAAGAVPLMPLDGISLRDVAQGRVEGYDALAIEAGPAYKDVPDDQYLYRGVRTDRYTYMEHPVTGEIELYDRVADPYQLDNVAYRPTHRATRDALAAMLRRLGDCAGASCHQPAGAVPEPEPAEGPVHPDQLGSLGRAKQVVTVTASRWRAQRGIAVAWQRRGRTWKAVRGPVRVRVGEAGMAPVGDRVPGSTPAGTHAVSTALGIRPDPGVELPYRRLGGRARLPLDRRSTETYNVLQRFRSPSATWRPRAEVRFADYPGSFERGLVVDYNRPRGTYWSPRRRQWMARVPADVRAGSFLLHTGRRVPGQGWVAMRVRDLDWLLRWADPEDKGTRLVVGTPRYLRNNL